MKKIFFFDIDGTIVDSSRDMHLISEKTKYAIRELSKNDYVFISSGRCKAMLNKQIIDLNAGGYILCNGAYAEINNIEIYKESFSESDLEKIKEVSLKYDGFYCLESLNEIYVNSIENETFNRFTSSWSNELDYLKEDDGKYKDIHIAMIGFKDRKVMNEVEKELNGVCGLDRHFWFDSFDVNVKGISKGYGCIKAMEYLNISKENSYAFGDGLNDLQMLEAVGHPVIMDNCMKQLKNRGFEETTDVLDDGVYEYLVKKQLIKPID